jgi:hypothetical protein
MHAAPFSMPPDSRHAFDDAAARHHAIAAAAMRARDANASAALCAQSGIHAAMREAIDALLTPSSARERGKMRCAPHA